MDYIENYIAYHSDYNEYNSFETFEEAVEWLHEMDASGDDGIPNETIEGRNFIAQITHRSNYKIIDKKSNYHCHDDNCPDDCKKEEWPYQSEFEVAGSVEYLPVEKNDVCPICKCSYRNTK